MSHSTFYSDGFHDCINYLGFLPPSPPQIRSDGEISDCHAQEYREGFDAGTRVIAQGKVLKYRGAKS